MAITGNGETGTNDVQHVQGDARLSTTEESRLLIEFANSSQWPQSRLPSVAHSHGPSRTVQMNAAPSFEHGPGQFGVGSSSTPVASTSAHGRKRPREDGHDGNQRHRGGRGGPEDSGSPHHPSSAKEHQSGLGSGVMVGTPGSIGPVAQRSCEECKRRKVKCDRQVPCGACVRRGNSSGCAAELSKPKPARRINYALASDVERLTRRLAEVEKVLKIRPPPTRDSSENIGGLGGNHSNYNTPSDADGHHDDHEHGEHEADELESALSNDDASQLERATETLEITAYDSKAPDGAGHRAVDSLVFFDNTSATYNFERARKGRAAERDLERTRDGTSILAPLQECWWSCAAEMGLDIRLDASEVPAARAKAVIEVMQCVMPTKEVSEKLVDIYFDGLMHLLFEIASKDVCISEHERFWEMHEHGRLAEVDILWLAFICMLWALSTVGGGSILGQRAEIPAGAPSSSLCYSAARRLLHLGDWSGTPRVRTLQVILMMGNWVQMSPGGEASRFMTWLAGGIRVAQGLGLHKLGSDPEVMPLDDAAWPPGKNARKRQMALRLFSALRMLDYSSSIRYGAYLLHDEQVTSEDPANVEMSSLSKTDSVIVPQPDHIITDASFVRCKSGFIRMARLLFHKVTLKSHVAYETVLQLDQGYRAVLKTFPTAWQDISVQETDIKTRWFRHACQEAIHNRLVKIHRPFMMRGYNDSSPYHYSTQSCIEAARVVIMSHHDIMDITRTIWFSYSHVLTASLALFADLFYCIDHGVPEAELDEKSEFLVRAASVFATHQDQNNVIMRNIGQQSAKCISGLFMAERKRRRLRENGGSRAPQESFTQVLQQITRDLASKSPAPPPPNALHYARNRSPVRDRPTTSTLAGNSASHDIPSSTSTLALPPSIETQYYQALRQPQGLSQEQQSHSAEQKQQSYLPTASTQLIGPFYLDQGDSSYPFDPSVSLNATEAFIATGAAPFGLEEAVFNPQNGSFLGGNVFDWSWLEPGASGPGDGFATSGGGLGMPASNMAASSQFGADMQGW